MPIQRLAAATLSVALLAACNGSAPSTAPSPSQPDTLPPAIQRQMRGIWIATVGNIDWPSASSLTAEQQRAELDLLMDRASAGGMNAVILQVRPAADALYASTLEPWAAWLTGTQGRDPGYDPLAYAVAQAHARGLELHAWINPYRAGNTKDTLALAATHIWNARRDLVRVYGTQLWMDPGEPAVQDRSAAVALDIVQRYDVDGIHADDYFYPYVQNDSAGVPIDFPDSASYARSGTTLSRADWRRQNVDRFIERLSREVHAIKPSVKVGISPFGIWRPGNPPGVVGLDAYASIYADSRKWLQEGWVDYLAPQLYWPISSTGQSFPALLDWWIAQNLKGRHLWPGLASYRVQSGASNQTGPTEIFDEITLIRQRAGSTGELLYNATSTLRKNDGALLTGLAPLYMKPALVPASPWLDATAPSTPAVQVSGRTVTLLPAAGEAPRWWVVRWRDRGPRTWTSRTLFGAERSLALPVDADRVMVNAADQAGNLTATVTWTAP